jgi:hypothetical protein
VVSLTNQRDDGSWEALSGVVRSLYRGHAAMQHQRGVAWDEILLNGVGWVPAGIRNGVQMGHSGDILNMSHWPRFLRNAIVDLNATSAIGELLQISLWGLVMPLGWAHCSKSVAVPRVVLRLQAQYFGLYEM